LQQISLDLNRALSVEDVAAAAVRALDAPVSGSSRGVYVLDEDNENLVLVAQQGMLEAAVQLFGRLPVTGELPGAVAVRELRTVVSTARAQAEAEFIGLEGAPRSTEGFVAVPLFTDETCVGVLGVGFDEELDERDLRFLEGVGAQVAQSIVRVRLADREMRRHAELEFMASLTDRALEAADHVELMRSVCRAAVPTLGDWCSMYFVAETGGPPIVEFAHVDEDMSTYLAELNQRYPFDPNGSTGVPAVLRTGFTEYVPRLTAQLVDNAVATSRLSADEALPILERLGITSAITVPLRTKRRMVGVMQFVSAGSRRRYTPGDVALAEAIAGRLGEALDAAWMADHQRSVAVALQRAFLPPNLPTIPSVDIAARYWPAGIDQVGGDFYDVFSIGPDHWALLIGDVCGTGPDAAALTGIARHTVRAAARHGSSPESVVSWLNEAVLHSDRDRYCTACYATLQPHARGWTLTITAAGHPLPILSTVSGTAMFGSPGSLVGIFETMSTHTRTTELVEGDVVVLYTDGLTDLPAPYGVDPQEIVSLVHQHRSGSAGEIADAIRTSLELRVPDRNRRDDVALLVAVIRPARSKPAATWPAD
jgi:serine phosphatase RsbU (regulator of sigma subunit)/putative methionine-R-sulfoxide reductase with GAF domain